mmetsp:Transcript_108220/g.183154  ORF Transcript_108220/g.183154 Transcript_108220/m.183154 type:complete len:126 (+) Transcript_108220:504-881(+)|eukprot:CAMPEP_0174289740 /NCGR_PEP_ID=MMETSP0809-20121228/26137_1 /TAXON_ID=73025 ORGANISM="Eutreptiella gymnastica-like, Strain CCMP1594" /NCGR_SAMPLE_ID=MMETSP0809 /ASSEMBLY_ACC=CAM_ASM_000658 /LENGTH=125 /DNA_ID=CAMNT_0015387867 /DNA_START=477 /DNA_END=854 /DNA_ORIENTATION=+
MAERGLWLRQYVLTSCSLPEHGMDQKMKCGSTPPRRKIDRYQQPGTYGTSFPLLHTDFRGKSALTRHEGDWGDNPLHSVQSHNIQPGFTNGLLGKSTVVFGTAIGTLPGKGSSTLLVQSTNSNPA